MDSFFRTDFTEAATKFLKRLYPNRLKQIIKIPNQFKYLSIRVRYLIEEDNTGGQEARFDERLYGRNVFVVRDTRRHQNGRHRILGIREDKKDKIPFSPRTDIGFLDNNHDSIKPYETTLLITHPFEDTNHIEHQVKEYVQEFQEYGYVRDGIGGYARNDDGGSKFRVIYYVSYKLMNLEEYRDERTAYDFPVNKLSISYDRFGIDDWTTAEYRAKLNNGKCGVDTIYDLYANNKNMTKWFVKEAAYVSQFPSKQIFPSELDGNGDGVDPSQASLLGSQATRVMNFLQKEFESIYKYAWDRKTLTARVIHNWAIAANITCYLATQDDEILCYNIGKLKVKSICGYVCNGHFYNIKDTSKIAHFREKAQRIKEGSDTLYVPGDQTFKRPKNEFDWKNCQTIVKDDIDNQVLFDMLSKKYERPTLIIVQQEDFHEYHEWILKEKQIVPYSDPDNTIIYGRPDSMNTVRAMACPQYEAIKKWCDVRDIVFDARWNIATVMLAIFHESTCVYESKDMFNAEYYNEHTARQNAESLARGYIHQDRENGFPTDNNITGCQIYDMWLKVKHCAASGRYVYLHPDAPEEIKASIDRISNKLPHTLANCRLMSLYDNKRRNTQEFHVYRSKENYLPVLNSAYTNEMVNRFVRTPILGTNFDDYAFKERAIHQRYADAVCLDNISGADIEKSYAGCMYQSHFGNKLDEWVDKEGHQVYFDWPVFSMYDLPEPFLSSSGTYLKPGRYYLDFTKPLTLDGHVILSNGWYSHPEVWYFQNKTDAKFTITHQWIASKKLPYYVFRKFISDCRTHFPVDAKFMINMMYGMLGKDRVRSVKKYFTTEIAWAAFYMFRNGTPGKNSFEEHFLDDEQTKSVYLIRTKTITNMQSNAMPIHNMINGMGRIRQIHLYSKMRRVGPCRLLQLKTDDVSVEYLNHEDKIKCDSHVKASKHYRLSKYDPFYEIKPPSVNTMQFQELKPIEWNKPAETTQPLREYLLEKLAEDTAQNKLLRGQIATFINMNGSFALEGLPGTAKSHIMKLIKQYYDSQEIRATILTPTNAAACRFITEGVDAQTIHSGLFINTENGKSKQTPKNVQVLLIDEISMVPSNILETILEIKRAHNLIIITGGDWNQLDAVKDVVPIEQRMNSRLYADLVDMYKFTFTENIRSDNSMFDIYKSIAENKNIDQIKPWLDTRKTTNLLFRNICKTNNKRLEVIKQCTEAYVNYMIQTYPGIPVCDVVFNEHGSGETPTKLSVRLVPNVVIGGVLTHCMPLIAQTNDKKLTIVKGNRYYLKSWDAEAFLVIDDAGQILSIPSAVFPTLITLAFCTTVHKAQGVTIKEPFKLHEIDQYTWRMAYVALSRTTSPEHIFIAH